MEARGLFFIFLGLFILLMIATFVITPGVKIDTSLDDWRGCEERCGNDNACVGACKTALVNQAFGAGETGVCDELVNTDEQRECAEMLRLDNALKSQDSGLCVGLKTESDCRDLMLYNKALNANDKSLCSGIADEKTRGMCNEI